jgi:hypothetical protein
MRDACDYYDRGDCLEVAGSHAGEGSPIDIVVRLLTMYTKNSYLILLGEKWGDAVEGLLECLCKIMQLN